MGFVKFYHVKVEKIMIIKLAVEGKRIQYPRGSIYSFWKTPIQSALNIGDLAA